MFFSSVPFIVLISVVLLSAIKVLNEYERGVVFRLGKFAGVRGPGLIILIPGIEKMVKDNYLIMVDITNSIRELLKYFSTGYVRTSVNNITISNSFII